MIRHHMMPCLGVLVLLCGAAPHQEAGQSAKVTAEMLRSTDRGARESAIENLRRDFTSDPRNAATILYKSRLLDSLLGEHRFSDAVELSTLGIDSQLDALDRVEYFLVLRTRCLSQMGNRTAALSSAKSYYNVCGLRSSPAAIDLVAECIGSSSPDERALAARWRMQQFQGATTLPAARLAFDLGDPVLVGIGSEQKDFTMTTGSKNHNRDWAMAGAANLALLQGRCDDANMLFEKMTSSPIAAIADAGKDGIARTIKAKETRVGGALNWLETTKDGTSDK